MKLDELFKQVEETGLLPVQILNDNDIDDKGNLLWVAGNLEQYLKICKQLGAKAVFMCPDVLDEELFFYDPDSDDYYDDDEFEDGEISQNAINLIDIEKGLEKFKDYVGENLAVELICIVKEGKLYFREEEPWCHEFFILQKSAYDRADEHYEKIALEQEEQLKREEEEEEIKIREKLDQLDNLLGDSDFRGLPGRGQMKIYALEEYPDLEDLPEKELDRKIEWLFQKVRVRKKRKK